MHTLTSLLPNLTNAHIDLTSSASKLTDLAKELWTITNSLQSIPAHSSATPHTPFHHHSYAAILANPPQPITHAPSPLVTPEHILHIENRLRLQERQIYITLNPDTIILHADRRRTEAIELRTKLNNELSALEASRPSPESRHTVIRALQYTDCNALLIEFDTPDSVKAFCSYCTSSNFQSHISPVAKILPRVFHIIMKFVPCDGSFDPKDENQLRIIEKDHDLEEGSIILADWIKKPSRCTPNQKIAHIRFLCASPTIANKLLSGHVFLANALICVQKDLQEPICCNKCQEYGHIRNSCSNPERCATCALEHPTADCIHPVVRRCVSCGPNSNHASSDCDKCPQFTKHSADLALRLPENALPYFPIIGCGWTFHPPKNLPPPCHFNLTSTPPTSPRIGSSRSSARP